MLSEYLLNEQNYKNVSIFEAEIVIATQTRDLLDAYFDNKTDIEIYHQEKYFEQQFKLKQSQWPTIYGPVKVHKTKVSLGPILSKVGLFGKVFSIFLDKCLNPLVQETLPSYIIISDKPVRVLTSKFPQELPEGSKRFSCDAVGMYTNLDTNEGAEFIEEFMNKYGDQLVGP